MNLNILTGLLENIPSERQYQVKLLNFIGSVALVYRQLRLQSPKLSLFKRGVNILIFSFARRESLLEAPSTQSPWNVWRLLNKVNKISFIWCEVLFLAYASYTIYYLKICKMLTLLM